MGRAVETFNDRRSRKRWCIRNVVMVVSPFLLVAILAWKLCMAAKPTAIPVLTQRWHEQVYSLDEGETVRLISPPFSPQRGKEAWIGGTLSGRQAAFSVIGNEVQRTGTTTDAGDVGSAIEWCTSLKEPDLDLP